MFRLIVYIVIEADYGVVLRLDGDRYAGRGRRRRRIQFEILIVLAGMSSFSHSSSGRGYIWILVSVGERGNVTKSNGGHYGNTSTYNDV